MSSSDDDGVISRYLDVLNRDSIEVGFLGISEAELPSKVDDLIHGDSAFRGPYLVKRSWVTIKDWIRIVLESPNIGGGSPGDKNGIGFKTISKGIEALKPLIKGGGFRESYKNNIDDDDGWRSGSGSGSGSGSISAAFRRIAPDWLLNLRTIATASVVAGGSEIYLREDPVAYVRAILSGSLIDAVQTIVGTIANGFLMILGIFTGALGDAGSSLLGSFGSVGDVSLLLIDTLNNTIATLAASAGPLSPIVVVVIYGGIVVVVAGAVRVALVATGFAP